MKRLYKAIGSIAVALSVVIFAAGAFAGDTAKLSVDGMTCDGCVNSVKQALEKVDGVQAANVDLKSESAVVMFNPGETTLESLEEAVASAGYTASTMPEDKPQENNMKSKKAGKDKASCN